MIPKMTDPLGRYWEQPPADEILTDENYALMYPSSFDKLLTYNCSQPSGAYPGKMWKRECSGKWFLMYFDSSELGPNYCSTKHLLIELL